jgi:fructose-1,6-bisphosphatase II
VHYTSHGVQTHSIVMRSKSGTIREVASEHRLEKLGQYAVVDFSRAD